MGFFKGKSDLDMDDDLGIVDICEFCSSTNMVISVIISLSMDTTSEHDCDSHILWLSITIWQIYE